MTTAYQQTLIDRIAVLESNIAEAERKIFKYATYERKENVARLTKKEYTIQILEKYMKKHKLKGWTYGFTKAKKTAGTCCPGRKNINISNVFIDSENTNKKQIKNVILHEIAHSLTIGHNHDKVWRAKALEIGCDGKRCCDSF
jgi:predicted metal-dependent hydrolase